MPVIFSMFRLYFILNDCVLARIISRNNKGLVNRGHACARDSGRQGADCDSGMLPQICRNVSHHLGNSNSKWRHFLLERRRSRYGNTDPIVCVYDTATHSISDKWTCQYYVLGTKSKSIENKIRSGVDNPLYCAIWPFNFALFHKIRNVMLQNLNLLESELLNRRELTYESDRHNYWKLEDCVFCLSHFLLQIRIYIYNIFSLKLRTKVG